MFREVGRDKGETYCPLCTACTPRVPLHQSAGASLCAFAPHACDWRGASAWLLPRSLLHRCAVSNLGTGTIPATAPGEQARLVCLAARALRPLESMLSQSLRSRIMRAQLPPHVIADLLGLRLWPSSSVLDLADTKLVPGPRGAAVDRDQVCVLSVDALVNAPSELFQTVCS